MSASEGVSPRTPNDGAHSLCAEELGPKTPNKYRRKKRLAKGFDEFSRFVEIIAADMQESVPELGQGQGQWPNPNEDHLDQTEEEGTDLGPGVNCMTSIKYHAQALIEEMCAACGEVPALETAYPMVVEMKHDVR
ncbi:hypothetical protein HD806DRAFT_531232 [Xylariaceae sp. AK1471]|nr:hypothetical protein HD806DRAFT_531232 [Xylariaceae sp. AK1471]